jgi:gamma-glutamylcyclotransferase (GGCT)/AIG2-like uncharacterized protein YtfP
MSKKLNTFFVYGTLKVGRPLDRQQLAKARTSVQEATIKGSIFSLGPYPTIKLDGKGLVIGEVHTFPEKHVAGILRMLDAIEGYSAASPELGLYNRHIVKATIDGSDEVVDAYVYEYNGEVGKERRLEAGVWEPGM